LPSNLLLIPHIRGKHRESAAQVHAFAVLIVGKWALGAPPGKGETQSLH